jgi:hypothetical protein
VFRHELPSTAHAGDCANPVVAAAGCNFSLLLQWFEWLLRAFFMALRHALAMPCFAYIFILIIRAKDIPHGRLLRRPGPGVESCCQKVGKCRVT